MALSVVPFAILQRMVDDGSGKPEVIVRDATGIENGFGFRQCLPALVAVFGKRRLDGEGRGTKECHANFANLLYGGIREVAGLWHLVLRGRQYRQRSKSLGLEITRANRPGDVERKFQVNLSRVEFSAVEFYPSRQIECRHFCTAVAHRIRQLDACQRVLKGLLVLHEVNPAPSDHVAVSHLDASESIFPADRQAGAKLLTGGAHMAAQVIGITEAAQRQGLTLD